MSSYCVIETGSKQYRVNPGDRVQVERLMVDAGQPFTFERVLLVNHEGTLSIGSPTVANAAVVADVVEHIRGDKKVAFKMKRRKGYHKTIGHRQELTVVKIKEIRSESRVVTEQAAATAKTSTEAAPEAASETKSTEQQPSATETPKPAES